MKLHDEDIKRLAVVKHYIDSNLHEDLSIDTLCQNTTFSKSTLKRHFRLHFKMSVHNYILEQRLYKALELLCSKSKNVGEIASLVGYNDRRSFSRAFTKFFGRPPKDCYNDPQNR